MDKKSPTLETIAKTAGVSKWSVSIALNGKQGVSESTRRRVREVAQKLGFEVNPLVSSLMNQVQRSRTRKSVPTVGFVILRPRNDWPFLEEMRKGIQTQAQILGYNVSEFFVGEDGMTPEKTASILKSRGIEGVIVGDGAGSKLNLPLYFQDFVTVLLGNSVVKPDMNRVCAHFARNIRVAIEGLRSLGYRKIGFFMDQVKDERSDYHYSSIFSATMDSLPSQQRIPNLILPLLRDSSPFKEWYAKYRPEVILGINDTDITRWVKEMGLRIPEDLGLAHLALKPGQKWSGINQNFPLMAETAVELLDMQFRTHRRSFPTLPKVVLVPGYWVAGETTSRKKKE